MLGLALEGGGAKGSYEIGAYVALKKLGYKFDAVAGTSIGSLNAALIAQNNMELAKKLWLNADSEIIGINKQIVDLSKHFKLNKENIKLSIDELNRVLKNKGLNINNYKNIINNYIDENKIRKSNINYGSVTVRLKDLKPLELTIKEIEQGKLSEYIMASSYLPVFKMEKIIDNSYYLDGGVSNNLPISLLEKMGCQKVIAIRIDGVGVSKKKLISKTEVIELAPTKDTGPVIFFDNNDIKNNYYMGYFDTLLHFNKIDGNKYYFKKFHFYNLLNRKANKQIINLIKLKFRTPDIKEMTIKAIEDILENNKVNYYEVYSIPKIIKYIKENKLKSKHKIINDYINELKFL